MSTFATPLVAPLPALVAPFSPQHPPADFARRVMAWQQAHGRHDLPWQQTRDPYRIWLSEIMLQQTQVQTVLTYYTRFLQHFPDLDSLAQAPLEVVMSLWSGLGYYARGRNLHACAQRVKADLGGVFPRDPAAIAALPGIGRSTAHAIAAFAFGAPVAILDGNVKRVLARCFGMAGVVTTAPVERQLWALAEFLLPAGMQPDSRLPVPEPQQQAMAAYTQGMMDLGAGICRQRQPRCADCPLADGCVARQQGLQAQLPTIRGKRVVPQRTVPLALLLRSDTGGQPAVYLEQRPSSGIWGGLFSLPEMSPMALAAQLGLSVDEVELLPPRRHALTHFRLLLEVQRAWVSGCEQAEPGEPAAAGGRWWPLAELATAPLPTPIRRILLALPETQSSLMPP